jgi:outer membrane protein OmpA-like peptidoglycan-associated protein
MKKKIFYLSLFLALATALQATAQKKTSGKSDSKSKTTAKKSKGSDNSVKNKDAMFTEKNKSWVVGVHAGYPFVIGDIPPQFGIGYGLNIQKALGYSFGLRLNGGMGYSTGLNWQLNSAASLTRNDAVNGVNDPRSNYFAAGKGIYTNYKMSYTKVSIEALYYLNNINFNTENSKFLLYIGVGLGGFGFDTKVDQLDANGNMYDYSKVSGNDYSNRKATYSALKSLLDGNYETQGDRIAGTMLGNQKVLPFISGIVGVQYKVSERIAISLEGNYSFTGTDELDGQKWYAAGVPSSNPDAFGYVCLGVNIRLGKVENASWFSNPLSLPYKTLMENKKKLEKVDKLQKDVDNLNHKLDTAMSSIDSLMKDTDGDGVADHFDKEDSTPPGAVVDGSGRTIFYKDADGNLVYVDPNVAYSLNNSKGVNGDATGNMDNGGDNNGNNGNVSNNGDNNGTGDNNNTGGNNNGGKNSKRKIKTQNGKVVFDPGDKTGKTIIYTNPSNKTTVNNNYAGTNSRFGFLPAVFFESNSANLGQNFYPQLYEIAKVLRQNPTVKMHVIGYTDYRASTGYNKKLGMRRAKAVEHALTTYFGVSSAQLIIESKGKVDPLTNAKTMGALAANRRVQFQVDGEKSIELNSDLGSKDKGTTVKTKTVKTTKTAPKTKKTTEKNIKNDGTPDNNTNSVKPDAKKEGKDTVKKEDVFTPGNDF